MSGAFDAAWAVLKMARYTAGPYEIWDSAERYEERPPELAHLPEDKVYPMGANFGHEFKAGKVMMTPVQFHSLVGGPAPEHRTGQQVPILAQMNEGAPIAAPYLKLTPEDGRFRVDSHEGRHRMQALRDAGYGDVRVPVELQSSKFHLGHDMTNEKFRDALDFNIIRPEYGYYGVDELARARSRDDIGEEYRYGLHRLNEPFLVRNIDPVWTRGEYR